MIIATGNNFGAGEISFLDYQNENMVILQGKFIVDASTEAFQSVDVLEIYVPTLTIGKSTEVPAYMVGKTLDYDDLMQPRGTIVKTWLKGHNTICIEKITDWDIGTELTYYFALAYVTLGKRTDYTREGKVDLKLVDPSVDGEWRFSGQGMCVVRDHWVFCCAPFDDLYTSEDDVPFTFRLEGLPDDIELDIPMIGNDSSWSQYGNDMPEFHIKGDLFSCELGLPRSINHQNGDQFFHFFAVRTGETTETE